MSGSEPDDESTRFATSDSWQFGQRIRTRLPLRTCVAATAKACSQLPASGGAPSSFDATRINDLRPSKRRRPEPKATATAMPIARGTAKNPATMTKASPRLAPPRLIAIHANVTRKLSVAATRKWTPNATAIPVQKRSSKTGPQNAMLSLASMQCSACRLTFDMSCGGRAQPVGRQLDGMVRRSSHRTISLSLRPILQREMHVVPALPGNP